MWPAKQPVPSSWCLDAASLSAGAQLEARQCDYSANQEFVIVAEPGSKVVYQSVADSSLCIAVGGPLAANVAAVLQTCSASQASDLWQFPAQI